jgi:hypothetical protein
MSRGASLRWATTMGYTHQEGVLDVLLEATPLQSHTLPRTISYFLMQQRLSDTVINIRWEE